EAGDAGGRLVVGDLQVGEVREADEHARVRSGRGGADGAAPHVGLAGAAHLVAEAFGEHLLALGDVAGVARVGLGEAGVGRLPGAFGRKGRQRGVGGAGGAPEAGGEGEEGRAREQGPWWPKSRGVSSSESAAQPSARAAAAKRRKRKSPTRRSLRAGPRQAARRASEGIAPPRCAGSRGPS